MQSLFQNFYSLDEASFAKLMSELGYASAACYRLKDKTLTYVIGVSDQQNDYLWPAFFNLNQFNYTTERLEDAPLGWFKEPFRGQQKKIWPKGIITYFPEQDLRISKFVMLLVPRTRKKIAAGELDGALEATVARIAQWTSDAEMRHFINEAVMHEHTRKLSLNTQTLIDHELRTPMSNIQGYAFLLKEDVPKKILHQHVDVILSQVDIALNAVEKLALTMRSSLLNSTEEREVEAVLLRHLVDRVCEEVASKDIAERGESEIPRLSVVCSKEMEDRSILGVEPLLYRALSEVVHNAVIYSLCGEVRISIYQMEEMVIIDVEDNGDGVPSGAEDLIFLQFFRGHNNQKIRRGHRGLGLGLYLARYVADQHLGQLVYVRRKEKGAMFRFILPLNEGERLLSPKLTG